MAKPYGKKKNVGVLGNKTSTPCKYFQRGKCSNQKCPYLHIKATAGQVIRADGVLGSKSEVASSSSNVMYTLLKLFFKNAQSAIYNPQTGTLDLSNLARYDDLREAATSVNFNTKTFCEALCAWMRDTFQPFPSILRLDHNDITTTHHLAKAMEDKELHLALSALSLAGNKIKSTDVAQDLKSFTNLKEVYLVGNPVTQAEHYKQRVKESLPFIVGLDGEPIAALPLALQWPRFFNPTLAAPTSQAEVEQATGPRRYTAEQRNILNFVQTQLLAPLERQPEPGVLTGVDAVSDVYALNAVLTLSLSCKDAAVSTPMKTIGGNSVSTQRGVIREIVGLRQRQQDGNHNVLLGTKSSQVAVGRTKVCAQLEHWLYPKTFAVAHFIHSSPDVAVLDNHGLGPSAPVQMKTPLSLVTLHGVIIWRYREPGSNADAQSTTVLRDALVMKRNFTRVLTVVNDDPGRWHIVNDAIALYPFRGTEPENTDLATLTEDNILLRDIHEYDIVYTALDPNRCTRLGRKYNVPPTIVETLIAYVQSDLELETILQDLGGVPMPTYEECAKLVNMDPLLSIFLCRLGNRYGLDPQTAGLPLLQQHGYNWMQIQQQVEAQLAGAGGAQF